MDEQLTTVIQGNGAPDVAPPVMYAPRPKRPVPWIPISIAVVMALLTVALASLLFFARQDLGAAERETSRLNAQVGRLEERTTSLEGEANGAELRFANLEAAASSCISGLEKALDLAQGLGSSFDRYLDNQLKSYELERDVKRDCSRATSLVGVSL